jgi:antitoxin component YwqK of YwqJK toxin-antitoxin module
MINHQFIYIALFVCLIAEHNAKAQSLFCIDTIEKISLPLGISDILQNQTDTIQIVKTFDNNQLFFDVFFDLFQCDESRTIGYDSLIFKEDYFDPYPVKNGYTENYAEFFVSSKIVTMNEFSLYFVIQSVKNWHLTRPRNMSLFLLSVKNGNVIDAKKIFYHEVREMGYTYGRRFYMDGNLLISCRDYSFTEDGIDQMPFNQYKMNSNGKFIHFYPEDKFYHHYDTLVALSHVDEERGIVQHHTRDGKWIEIKPNVYVGGATYLEADYKEGLPAGKWKFYRLEQQSNDDGFPILSSRRKGKLLYTETYKNGEMIKRKFAK